MSNDSSKHLDQSESQKAKQSYKNLGSPFRVIVNTLIIFLASQFVAVLIVMIGLAITHPNTNISLNDSVSGRFVFILIAELLAAYLAIRLVRRRGFNLAAIGLGRRPKISDLTKAAIGFGIFYGLWIIVIIIIDAFLPALSKQKQDIGFENLRSSSDTWLAFISLVILPPLGEEILMRGYLYSGLRKVWRFVPALLVTSLFFGAAHLQLGNGAPLVWAAAIGTFILSVILVFLRERTGALYAGILVHMLNNLIAFLIVIK